MQASRPSSEAYFRQSYIPGRLNVTIEPEMHFQTTTTLQHVLSNVTTDPEKHFVTTTTLQHVLSNVTIEPEMHFQTTTTLQQLLSNLTVLWGLQLNFSLGEEGEKYY